LKKGDTVFWRKKAPAPSLGRGTLHAVPPNSVAVATLKILNAEKRAGLQNFTLPTRKRKAPSGGKTAFSRGGSLCIPLFDFANSVNVFDFLSL